MNKILNFLKKYKVKIIIIIFIIIFCSIATYISTPSSPKYREIPKIDLNQFYQVIKVVDGDTIEIKLNNATETVRMLGIDTPETVDPRKPVQCFGKEASDKTREMLENKSVNIKIDKSQLTLDKYGRILAYVYREDGLFINELLLKDGYAREYTYGKPYQMKKEFKKLEKEANKNKRGLWEKCLR